MATQQTPAQLRVMKLGLMMMATGLVAMQIGGAQFVSKKPWPPLLEMIGGLCFFGWLPLFALGTFFWLRNRS
jgi:hypothetical protein